MKGNNKHKATAILMVFSLGFLISYPFRGDNFWIGLFSGACAASMVGGFADWFAVTAIFRRPLGIYWPRSVFRTEIIPRNREGIIRGLVDIVENELLTKESIHKKILDVNLYETFLGYIEEKSINEDLKAILKNIVNELLKNIEKKKAIDIINSTFEIGLERFDLSNFLSDFLMFLRQNQYDDEIIDFSMDMLAGFVRHNKTHLVFTNFVENVIAEYENGSGSRAMTIKMLLNFVLKKSPSDLAKMLEDGLVDTIYEVKARDNSNRIKLKDQINSFSGKLRDNARLKEKIEEWKESNVLRLSPISEMLANTISSYNIGDPKSGGLNIEGKLDELYEKALDIFVNDKGNSDKLEIYFKNILINFVDKKHSTIGMIVRDRINQFSTEELVELIENTAGNDLQMIRINGSVVGGIVGVITYLLTYYLR